MNGLTQKQENFTQNLFKGMSQREAWTQAGYSTKYAPAIVDVNACKLANLNKIQLRWDELKRKAEDASVATVIERKQVLTEIVRGRMTDFMTVGADGTYFDVGSEKLHTAAIMSAGSKTEIDKDGNGQTVFTRVYLHNPVKAIAELNKMDHIYDEGARVNIDNRTLVINVMSEQARNLTRRLIEGERTGGDNNH